MKQVCVNDCDLLAHPLDDLGCCVPDARDADAGGEIQERVAVHVHDHTAPAAAT
jgi:hypothetical protein